MIAMAVDGYDRNVFINCPFDLDYQSLLYPLLFTICCLRFTPRIALERSDSTEPRLPRIIRLISESRYSIHDLSRLQAGRKGEFYRLNMPFELGIEYGCRLFGPAPLDQKRCLILEREPYQYVYALSDPGGVDARCHQSDPSQLVRGVRNWFVDTAGLRGVASGSVIWYAFNDFINDFRLRRATEGFADEDLRTMPIGEFIAFVRQWLEGVPAVGSADHL